ncbi:MATE family efflux transporter [Luteimonas gilva]|uniref:MATE family efflux transporter n=1 Tax=Luteimonas gilva TaxID=2572684 RepID=A0A4U5JXY8_9GAMM|nr:MATE family efflux transporter [Luteimonas gilva]TKR33658.1 MATE family efflux transporter [Luteimonas gilva]
MKTSRDLTQGPIGPTLLAFLLPILAGGVLQSLNGSVNAVWVGRFLGEQALTATANANNIMFFLVGAVFGIGMASTILVGQSIGAKDMVQAKRVIGTSFTFFVAISLTIALVGMLLSHRILVWMSTPAEALPLAEAYLRIVFMAVPFIYVFAMLQATLRGAGDTRTPFVFLLMGVGLDIAFNPLFIFGIGPFPEMGIAGSATAMLIANSVSLAAMILWLRHKRHPLWISRHENRVYKPDWGILRALIVKGVPMGLQMIVISLAMIMMISMVNGYGVDTTSAYGAAMQLWAYIQMPAMAIGAACSSMAAQNVGAKRWDRVSAAARTGILFNFLLTGVLILPTIAFDRSTLSLFLPEGSAALEHARHLNHIAVWSFLFFGVTFVISGVVRATGAVLPPLLILAMALWGIRIPFAEFLQPSLGADAIWWSFPVSSVCAMLMSLAYYKWGGWRKARMLAPHAEEVAIPAEVPAQPPSPVADQGTKV